MSKFLPLLLSLILAGCQPSTEPTPAVESSEAPGAVSGTVTIEVVKADSTETYEIKDVVEGSTLETALRSAEHVPIEIRGSGMNAFVDSIDGQTTSGGEGWTYTVDGDFAHEGIGSLKLSPPTTIRWSFGDGSEMLAE